MLSLLELKRLTSNPRCRAIHRRPDGTIVTPATGPLAVVSAGSDGSEWVSGYNPNASLSSRRSVISVDKKTNQEVQYMAHPAFPDVPEATPLTYTLTMHACLCMSPAERPTFDQVGPLALPMLVFPRQHLQCGIEPTHAIFPPPMATDESSMLLHHSCDSHKRQTCCMLIRHGMVVRMHKSERFMTPLATNCNTCTTCMFCADCDTPK